MENRSRPAAAVRAIYFFFLLSPSRATALCTGRRRSSQREKYRRGRETFLCLDCTSDAVNFACMYACGCWGEDEEGLLTGSITHIRPGIFD